MGIGKSMAYQEGYKKGFEAGVLTMSRNTEHRVFGESDRYEEIEMKLAEWIDRHLYLPVREEMKGKGTHSLGRRKEDLKGEIFRLFEEMRKHEEVIVDGLFKGQLEYSNSGMRHNDELELSFLEKGDKVIIVRKKKK